MTEPLAIVIPFGVPTDGQGLGLGLAALVHAFVHVDGSSVAIAQLHARPNDEKEARSPPLPVEAFVQTGDRTMLSYLVKPLSDQLMRAFREK